MGSDGRSPRPKTTVTLLTRRRPTPRPARGGVIRLDPLDDLDPIPVGVAHEEAIRPRYQDGLLDGDAVRAEVVAGRVDVGDAQREVTRADRVRLRGEQEVELFAAEVEPQDAERERARLGDLAEAEEAAVEAPLRSRSVTRTEA